MTKNGNDQSHGHGLRLGSVSSTKEILNISILCRRIGIYSNATEIYEEVVDDIKINFTCLITIVERSDILPNLVDTDFLRFSASRF